MSKFKGQAGSGVSGTVLSLIVLGSLLAVGLVVYTTMFSSLPGVDHDYVGESLTTIVNQSAVQTKTLAHVPVLAASLTLYLATPNQSVTLIENVSGPLIDTHYLVNYATGLITLNYSNNGTASAGGSPATLTATYTQANSDAGARTTYNTLRSTTLNAFNLMAVAAIVIAAVAILGYLFVMGGKK